MHMSEEHCGYLSAPPVWHLSLSPLTALLRAGRVRRVRDTAHIGTRAAQVRHRLAACCIVNEGALVRRKCLFAICRQHMGLAHQDGVHAPCTGPAGTFIPLVVLSDCHCILPSSAADDSTIRKIRVAQICCAVQTVRAVRARRGRGENLRPQRLSAGCRAARAAKPGRTRPARCSAPISHPSSPVTCPCAAGSCPCIE